MRKLKFINILCIVGFLIILNACEDSSNFENIIDPGDIKPIIKLTNTYTEVVIKNKKGEHVEIRDGAVYVNDKRMKSPNWLSSSYEVSMPVRPDSVYTFEIILSNGDSYFAWIETPEINLYYIDIPDSQSHRSDFRIGWLETDYRYPQELKIYWYDKMNLDSLAGSNSYNIEYPYKGEFIIEKKKIKYSNDEDHPINYARIYLFSRTEGVISKEFLPGGSISCELSSKRGINIY